MTKDRQALLVYAYWYPRQKATYRGQGISQLSCGHAGETGAPMCKRCADRLIDEVLHNEVTEDN